MKLAPQRFEPVRLLRDVSGSPYLLPPTKNAGDLLTSALWNSYVRDNLDFGVVRPIADNILVANAATVDFTSIAGTFAHLLVEIYARTDRAASNDAVGLRLNNDSAGNYYSETLYGFGATAALIEDLASAKPRAAFVPGNTGSPANAFGGGLLFIPHYAGSTNKKFIVALSGAAFVLTTGNVNVGVHFFHWDNTAAINRLTFSPINGTNLMAGSRITIYGMGAI